MRVRTADKGAPCCTGWRYVINKLAASAKEAYVLSSAEWLAEVTARDLTRLGIHARTTAANDSFPTVCRAGLAFAGEMTPAPLKVRLDGDRPPPSLAICTLQKAYQRAMLRLTRSIPQALVAPQNTTQ